MASSSRVTNASSPGESPANSYISRSGRRERCTAPPRGPRSRFRTRLGGSRFASTRSGLTGPLRQAQRPWRGVPSTASARPLTRQARPRSAMATRRARPPGPRAPPPPRPRELPSRPPRRPAHPAPPRSPRRYGCTLQGRLTGSGGRCTVPAKRAKSRVVPAHKRGVWSLRRWLSATHRGGVFCVCTEAFRVGSAPCRMASAVGQCNWSVRWDPFIAQTVRASPGVALRPCNVADADGCDRGFGHTGLAAVDIASEGDRAAPELVGALGRAVRRATQSGRGPRPSKRRGLRSDPCARRRRRARRPAPVSDAVPQGHPRRRVRAALRRRRPAGHGGKSRPTRPWTWSSPI